MRDTSSLQLPRCAHAQLTGGLHTVGQVDYFAVYSHELRKVYLLPVNEVSQTRMHLRLAPSKNKQERGVHWAADYEI
jgi:PD-(D/E)XK endonuclease